MSGRDLNLVLIRLYYTRLLFAGSSKSPFVLGSLRTPVVYGNK